MKVLYTAFNGKNNSSKILLDKITSTHKLYLKNSYITSVQQLEKELKENDYDLIVSIGQFGLNTDTIMIETVGRKEIEYKTKYDYQSLKDILISSNYEVIISNDAGTYFCNNLYYYGLKFIDENNINANMIFIHIPKINKISDIDFLARILNQLGEKR